MSYNRQQESSAIKNKVFVMSVFSIGFALLIAAAYQGLHVNAGIRKDLADQRDAEVITYLESIGARFSNDSELSVRQRIEILKHDHLLSSDNLGNIELIQKRYNEKINATRDDKGPFALFVAGAISIGFASLLLDRRW